MFDEGNSIHETVPQKITSFQIEPHQFPQMNFQQQVQAQSSFIIVFPQNYPFATGDLFKQ